MTWLSSSLQSLKKDSMISEKRSYSEKKVVEMMKFVSWLWQKNKSFWWRQKFQISKLFSTERAIPHLPLKKVDKYSGPTYLFFSWFFYQRKTHYYYSSDIRGEMSYFPCERKMADFIHLHTAISDKPRGTHIIY